MVNSKQKGKRGELMWRDFLIERGIAARRGQQFSGDPSAPDVIADHPGFHCEVKFREQHAPWDYMTQARSEAGPGAVPYVAMKSKNKPWLVVLDADAFVRLMRELRDCRCSEP